MKKKIYLFFIVTFILISLSLLIFLRKFSIYSGYVYTEEGVNKYFNRCNPCSFKIVVFKEFEYLDKAEFEINLNNKGEVCYDANIPLSSEPKSDCKQPCGPCYVTFTKFCKNRGYVDVGGCKDFGFPDTGLRYPNTCEIRCWKTEGRESSRITIKYGNELLYEWKNGMENKVRIDFADIINNQCSWQIEACKRHRNSGSEDDYRTCFTECIINVEVFADNSFGGFDVSTNPINLIYSTSTTTMTTTTMTTAITTIFATTTSTTTPTTTSTTTPTTTVSVTTENNITTTTLNTNISKINNNCGLFEKIQIFLTNLFEKILNILKFK